MAEENKQVNRVILVEGQLEKIIHEEGAGECPSKGQEVSALYRGTLENGQEFDSNQNRDSPFKFTIGQGQVIKGWDQGFASMKRGEKATLICSPDYAYGKRGSPPKIPPNSTLHFEVELLDFADKKREKWDMSPEEKVQDATKLKEEGNAALKEGNFKAAIKKYDEGIELVDMEEEESAKNILKILRLNVSQACLKAQQYAKAIENCTKVLKEDENNMKALYRRGVAELKNQDFDTAKADFEAMLAIDANNAEAKAELQRVSEAIKIAKAKEKKLFGGMFSKSGIYEDKKPGQKKETNENREASDQEETPELEKEEKEEKENQNKEDLKPESQEIAEEKKE